MERSQSWQIQQQHPQQQQQQQQYASAERQSQSGWFPLEDALLVSSQPQPQIVYATDEQLLVPQHQQQQQQQQDLSGRWVTQQTTTAADHPYAHDVTRLSIPSRPDSAMYPQHPQAQAYVATSSSSQEMGMVSTAHTGAGAYAAWPQDSRLSGSAASGPIAIADQFEDQYLGRPQPQYSHGGMAIMARSLPQPLQQQQQHMYQNQSSHPHPHLRSGRKAKEISIGRWNADEHKWFLKGLEMFHGPAWGEIARLIGTRTSTQVRTHAQKFFTKLARMNQTLPYFDAQIQKERTRLLAQGALGGSSTSVTPTSTSGSGGFNYALSNLSPRKRVNGSGGSSPGGGAPATASHHLKRDPQESDYTTSNSSLYGSSNSGGIPLSSEHHPSQPRMAEYADQVRSGGGGMAYYHHPSAEDNSNSELFKPKYDPSGGLSPLLRKPRMYIDANGHPVSAAITPDPVAQGYDALHHPHHHQYQQQHLGYATHAKDEFDASRQQHFTALDASQLSHHPQHQHQHQQMSRPDDMAYGMLHASAAADPWGGDDPTQRHWVALPPTPSSHADNGIGNSNAGGGSSLDADSLPSMNKLLYRGAAA